MRRSSQPCLWYLGIILIGFYKFPHHALGQQSQNPSPMVEHTRKHRRLQQANPPGERIELKLGTLFIPAALTGQNEMRLVVHFHGSNWLPEVAATELGSAASIAVQLDSGSEAYAKPFREDDKLFDEMLKGAEIKSGKVFKPLVLTGWSAGYGAIREILNRPEYFRRVDGVLLIDGLHTGYVNGKPGPRESELVTEPLDVFVRFAREAVSGNKRMLITHSEIFPGTFASTTETADYLLGQLELQRKAVLRWGPMGTQQLSDTRQGQFLLQGYAGNSAPDHVDQLHALPQLLQMLDELSVVK